MLDPGGGDGVQSSVVLVEFLTTQGCPAGSPVRLDFHLPGRRRLRSTKFSDQIFTGSLPVLKIIIILFFFLT